SFRLSGQASRCRRNFQCSHGHSPRQGRTPGKSNVGRPGAVGAYSKDLRALRPQCLGNGAPPQHAPAHAAAHFGEKGATLNSYKLKQIAIKNGRIFSTRPAPTYLFDRKIPWEPDCCSGSLHAPVGAIASRCKKRLMRASRCYAKGHEK